MTSLTILIVIFVGFGIYGAVSERRSDVARRRRELRGALERLSAERSSTAPRVRPTDKPRARLR